MGLGPKITKYKDEILGLFVPISLHLYNVYSECISPYIAVYIVYTILLALLNTCISTLADLFVGSIAGNWGLTREARNIGPLWPNSKCKGEEFMANSGRFHMRQKKMKTKVRNSNENISDSNILNQDGYQLKNNMVYVHFLSLKRNGMKIIN